MKINIISDMHIEFGDFQHSPKDCDAIIIAGDISGNNKSSVNWIKNNYGDLNIPIIFVSGNHEFYAGKEMNSSYKLAKELSDETDNIHCLQNGMIEIGDTIFVGSTLWTDFNLYNNVDIAKMDALGTMNDYKCIKFNDGRSYRKLKPSDTEKQFYTNRNYIKKMVEENKDKKIVVVTHHSPCGKSVPEKYMNDVASPSYASELSEFILDNPQIKAWVHGHIHTKCDYEIGDTRVVCNPRGYVSSNENPSFDPDFMVEV